MLFNSLEFLIFFPVVTLLYFIIPHKFRWFLLLTASCIFYMFFIWQYVFILLVTILIDYFAGMLIEKESGKRRKIYLIVSIISTCLVLFVFKYFNFFNANFEYIAGLLHWNYPVEALNIILPIGLSFHTFQSLSYVIEVYRGRQKAEKHFGIYALYVMFYPQLVAGPIERPQNLLHQFYEKHEVDFKRIGDGLKLMLWGFFKKVVIADRLAILVNSIYDSPEGHSGPQFIIATVFFAIQIFCDFSGYSDIAIGSAQVMGFKLMDNFRRPYFSGSVAEFWKRWHISLSTWFKDYLYISMGGNRVSKPRWYFNLFLTFLISGLWHGSNWTFVIWGALNGFYLIVSIWTKGIRQKIVKAVKLDRVPLLHGLLQITVTFALVCFAWIFFRARDVSKAIYIITHMFTGLSEGFGSMESLLSETGMGINGFIIAVGCIVFMEAVHIVQQKRGSIRQMVASKPLLVRWACYYTLLLVIILLGIYGSTAPSAFIYFQF